MSAQSYPVRVDATLEDRLSRWLWLVKWLLVVPHYVVLAFLWVAFVVLSAVALVAIVFTGRYPRAIFDFNVGVLRWTWRVAYYAYGGLATDHYPPFSLLERPDYPAHLEVEYPNQLSRGLVLVKWWLLAIPHYVVLGIFMGTGWYVVTNGDSADVRNASVGLIGLLVFVAAIVLMFTGRYPRPIFDLVLGLNRWVLRVAAYASLMTDAYPPFRLDMGGTDPATGVVTLTPAGATPATEGSPAHLPPPSLPPQRSRAWSAGRIVGVVLGSLLVIGSVGSLAAGGVVRLADVNLRDESGFLMSSSVELESSGYAITSENAQLHDEVAWVDLPERWLGTVQVEATGHSGDGVFVGIARTSDVLAYLDGVAHSVVRDPAGGKGGSAELFFIDGGSPEFAPVDAPFWVASASGEGTQRVTWDPVSGDWMLVVMDVDGTTPVAADVAVGATAPVLDDVALALLVMGLVLGALAAAVLIASLSRRAAPRVQ